MKKLTVTLSLLLLACGGTAERQEGGSNSAQYVPPMSNEVAATSLPEAKPPTPPPANETLAEPKGPIDPKSAEAAGQVVQSYGALIEQKRWTEANALWSDPIVAAQFQKTLTQFADVHLEIGAPGDPEGAAGSIYLTMLVAFYGQAKGGRPLRRPADVILRRVNDVPGSTEAQRRWHIERIELKPN